MKGSQPTYTFELVDGGMLITLSGSRGGIKHTYGRRLVLEPHNKKMVRAALDSLIDAAGFRRKEAAQVKGE
jgi:hypothetical protein